MYQTIVIGSGGTSSYAIPHLIRLYNNFAEQTREVLILDRDRVEERNLLRQGFLQGDVLEYKGEVLANRLQPIAKPHITIKFAPVFINTVQDLVTKVNAHTTHVTLVCGADNNMARLRIHIAAYVLQDRGIHVDVIDSGNAEFHGQVMISRFVAGASTFLSGIHNALNGTVEDWQAFELSAMSKRHRVTSVFTVNDNWRSRLNRGEHELGCQENVVAAPQNIGANMTAGSLILQAQYLLLDKLNNVGMLRFDTKANTVELVQTPSIEEGYTERIADILTYLKTDEGIEAIFGNVFSGTTTQQVTEPTEVADVQPMVATEPTETADVQPMVATETVQVPSTAPTEAVRRRAQREPRRTVSRRTVSNVSILDDIDSLLSVLDTTEATSLDSILNDL